MSDQKMTLAPPACAAVDVIAEKSVAVVAGPAVMSDLPAGASVVKIAEIADASQMAAEDGDSLEIQAAGAVDKRDPAYTSAV